MILTPFAALYGAVVEIHSSLYRHGLLKVSRLPVPVISVGNITAGGTGKTPLVEFIARVVAAEGPKVCILTRGYGRQNSNQRVLVSDGHEVLASVLAAGDEARLLAENLQGVAAVISDADRLAAGQWAIATLGSQVFVLDDGFQHLQLARDLNIATIDATNPWGGGHLLPRGRLRERPRGLGRADCVVITRARQAGELDSLKQQIGTLSHGRPIFVSSMRVKGWRRLDHSPAEPQREDFASFAAFSAIGNQRSFITLLESEGHIPVATADFPDHHRYSQRDVNNVIEKVKRAGARALVTTAKDAVKLRDLALDLPCYVMEIEVFLEAETSFVEMVRNVLGRR